MKNPKRTSTILAQWEGDKYTVKPETIEAGTSPWLIETYPGEAQQVFAHNCVGETKFVPFAGWVNLGDDPFPN